MSDQDRISPYNINTILSRLVMRIEENINLGIISWSNTKFSERTLTINITSQTYIRLKCSTALLVAKLETKKIPIKQIFKAFCL